jgi:hypothetical protein
MTDSLFGELDIASASDNPFFKPDGTYKCVIGLAEVRKSKKGNIGFWLEYVIKSGEPKEGKKITEWKTVPMPWELKGYNTKEAMENNAPKSEEVAETAAKNLSFLKVRLKEFGFNDDELNKVTQADIMKVGDVDVTIKNINDQERVMSVKLADGSGSDSSDPFA